MQNIVTHCITTLDTIELSDSYFEFVISIYHLKTITSIIVVQNGQRIGIVGNTIKSTTKSNRATHFQDHSQPTPGISLMSQVAGVKRAGDAAPPGILRRPTTDASAPHDPGEALTPLTSVAVACRLNPRVSAISEVVKSIDRFVGADAKWAVTTVCGAGLPGELRLLR